MEGIAGWFDVCSLGDSNGLFGCEYLANYCHGRRSGCNYDFGCVDDFATVLLFNVSRK